jgi:hypothetical protein
VVKMPPKLRPDKPAWYKSWLLKSTLLLLLVALFLGGVIVAGRWGMDQISSSERYVIAFTDIECQPPVGMDRRKFLNQVLYYASPRLHERLNLLDEDLRKRLSDGFVRHPWVEKVDDVEIKQPKQIIVKLTLRTPVLAVNDGAKMRAVDATGVLLPEDAPTLGLPIYDGIAKKPQGAGLPWGDSNVEAAARKSKK